ncbi:MULTISPECIES: phosphate-starvation-inducible PsiE family protein [Asaia]|uniref:Protein PsiE n=1 Tax=Asaia bogorensis TaxID=91915 RepID=A0A060QIQ6_9PROT|nr:MULTISPECIES: phosphate-starvation-inducible PsiE family protein [Asaia]ETC97308.1 hypothetical protein P792_16470 [Asaia sp. SF2.1]MDL2170897.1 phosphate-starvation-inducible PsiE family protein [Asaia sp. HumB]NIE80898.1 phosphate-starvation-inducible PsiE family protein [Asaia sp. As-1742]CDG40578.1 hypothetical protein ASAP_2533 [Asaia bogorensis]
MIKSIPGFFKVSTLFDLFEECAMLILTLCVMAVATLGLVHVVYAVFEMVRSATLVPSNPAVLQSLFGLCFTVLIALEFKHSILVAPDTPSHSLVRMRSVLLIGMMATVRKFIVLDLSAVDVMGVLALSASVLSLGICYWLVRSRKPVADSAAPGVMLPGAVATVMPPGAGHPGSTHETV